MPLTPTILKAYPAARTSSGVAMGKPMASKAISQRQIENSLNNNMSISDQLGPGVPPAPSPLDNSGRARQWALRPGWNLQANPDTDRIINFEVLRTISNTYDLLRKCLDLRKDEMAMLEWDVIPKWGTATEKREMLKRDKEKIQAVRFFFETPDADKTETWEEWLKKAVEDVLVIDALSIEKRRNKGGDLIGLDIIDGTTIRPLLSLQGRRPTPPDAAYAQVLYGVNRTEFTVEGKFNLNEMIYRPRNPKSYIPYGQSPVEGFLMHFNLALRQQMWQQAIFTDGDIPQMLLAAPENWSRDQIEDLQTLLASVKSGNPVEQRMLHILPHGTEAILQNGAQGYLEFSTALTNYIIDLTCASMDVTRQELGLDPSNSQGLGGSGRAEAQTDVQFRRSILPLAKYLAHVIFTPLLTDFGLKGYKWIWTSLNDMDAAGHAALLQTKLYSGQMSFDAMLQDMGEDGIGVGRMLVIGSQVLMEKDLKEMQRKGTLGHQTDAEKEKEQQKAELEQQQQEAQSQHEQEIAARQHEHDLAKTDHEHGHQRDLAEFQAQMDQQAQQQQVGYDQQKATHQAGLEQEGAQHQHGLDKEMAYHQLGMEQAKAGHQHNLDQQAAQTQQQADLAKLDKQGEQQQAQGAQQNDYAKDQAQHQSGLDEQAATNQSGRDDQAAEKQHGRDKDMADHQHGQAKELAEGANAHDAQKQDREHAHDNQKLDRQSALKRDESEHQFGLERAGAEHQAGLDQEASAHDAELQQQLAGHQSTLKKDEATHQSSLKQDEATTQAGLEQETAVQAHDLALRLAAYASLLDRTNASHQARLDAQSKPKPKKKKSAKKAADPDAPDDEDDDIETTVYWITAGDTPGSPQVAVDGFGQVLIGPPSLKGVLLDDLQVDAAALERRRTNLATMRRVLSGRRLFLQERLKADRRNGVAPLTWSPGEVPPQDWQSTNLEAVLSLVPASFRQLLKSAGYQVELNGADAYLGDEQVLATYSPKERVVVLFKGASAWDVLKAVGQAVDDVTGELRGLYVPTVWGHMADLQKDGSRSHQPDFLNVLYGLPFGEDPSALFASGFAAHYLEPNKEVPELRSFFNSLDRTVQNTLYGL